MPAVLSLVRHGTTLRLTRIATLVAGSLVFLYACEASRKTMLSDVRAELAVAGVLGITGLVTAWFEVNAADRAADRARTEIRGFLIETDGLSVRARITRSGDLVFHGHDSNGADPAYEWDWAYRSTTFPAIRTALGGGRGDLLALLEQVVPEWNRRDRYDPGAWLHGQGIPAAFRERGDSGSRITRELPVVQVGRDGVADEYDSPESTGAQQLSGAPRKASRERHRTDAAQTTRRRPSRGHRDSPGSGESWPRQGDDAFGGRRHGPSHGYGDEAAHDESPDAYGYEARNEPTPRRRDASWDRHREAAYESEPRRDRWNEPVAAQPQHGYEPGDRWSESAAADHEPDDDHWQQPEPTHRATPEYEAAQDHWGQPPARLRDEPGRRRHHEMSAGSANEPIDRPSRLPAPGYDQPPLRGRERSPAYRGDASNQYRDTAREERRDEPPGHYAERPGQRRDEPPRRREDEPADNGWNEPPNDRRNEPPAARRGESPPRRGESRGPQWSQPPGTRHGR